MGRKVARSLHKLQRYKMGKYMKHQSKEKTPLYKVGDWVVFLHQTYTVVSCERSLSGNKFFYKLRFEKNVLVNVDEEDIKLYHTPSQYHFKELLDKINRGELLL